MRVRFPEVALGALLLAGHGTAHAQQQAGQKCAASSECAGELICIQFRCVADTAVAPRPAPPPPAGAVGMKCASNSECGPGGVCVANRCAASTSDAGSSIPIVPASVPPPPPVFVAPNGAPVVVAAPAPVEAPSEHRSTGMMVAGIVVAGVGLPLTIGGGVKMSSDSESFDGITAHAPGYGTGLALVVVGAVSMVAGVTLAIVGGVSPSPATPSGQPPALAGGPSSGGWSWRF